MSNSINAESILSSVAVGVFTIDDNWKITSFNKAAEKITQFSKEEVIGKKCSDIFKTSICSTDCAFKETITKGKEIVNREVHIKDKHGNKLPISVCTALLRDEDGRPIGGVESFREVDISISTSEKEPERKLEDQSIKYRTKLTEKFTIIDTLEKNRWNRKKTAMELNIHLTTLWRKMKKYNIE